MSLIRRFDPWQSSLCTCPSKLTVNPYTGCDHNCVYCYARSYIPQFEKCRPKKNFLKRLRREAAKLKGEVVSLSNSSDPYPRIEAEAGLTRDCLKILVSSNCRIQIVTKSTIVERDVDVLKEALATVAITVTTLDDDMARRIEPYAPSPATRLKTVEMLVNKRVPVSVRIDPIFPFVNDDAAGLVASIATLGVQHITASTYKAKPDNWRRFASAMPEIAEKLKPLYWTQGERSGGCMLLPLEFRLKLLSETRQLVLEHGMKFGVCRESLSQLNTAACDGSWLLPRSMR